MDASIIVSIITQCSAIAIASGGWYFSVKKDREKSRDELQKTINENYDKMQSDLQELRDQVTEMGANLQQKMAILELQVNTLSERVEKHNQVIERTYKLEQAVEDLKRT